MATIINADTSTGGAIITGDASGELALQAAGVTKLTVSSAGVAIPTLIGANVDLTSNVSGTLPVLNGGTGAATLTGVIKGNGTAAITAATAGTDYVAPGTATTFTTKQTFSGSSSTFATKLVNVIEGATISATAATGVIAYNITTQDILYYTTNASANWTVNFRASATTTLNTALAVGEVITAVFMVTQGATAFYNNAVQIDGVAVTPKYQGGTAWTAGNASSIDAYSYTIIKTAATPTYTVFASQTKFA